MIEHSTNIKTEDYSLNFLLSVPIKGRFHWHASLHQNTYEVTMQVEHDIGKTTFRKLPIYYGFMFVCLVLRLHIFCFHKYYKTSFRNPFQTFYLRYKWSTSSGALTHCNTMKRSIENYLYRQGKKGYLLIVFSFKGSLSVHGFHLEQKTFASTKCLLRYQVLASRFIAQVSSLVMQ